MTCPCINSELLYKVKAILCRQIRWYEDNKHDESYVYDESWTKWMDLSRDECAEILRLLSEVR